MPIYKIKLSMFILKILNFHNHKTELFFLKQKQAIAAIHIITVQYMAEIKNKKTMNIFKYPKQEKQGKFSFNSKKNIIIVSSGGDYTVLQINFLVHK